jgi:hypothetical protein
LLSNAQNYVIPHFYIIWKILQNPPVGRPIVAGYKWIFTPASIFAGHFLKEFYSKFDSILNDSLSLVKLLEISRFDKTVFKSLYTNIPVDDAIKSIKQLCFDYQNVIPNTHFIIELLDLVLNRSLRTFDGKYFQQFFGLIMGTNVAPILRWCRTNPGNCGRKSLLFGSCLNALFPSIRRRNFHHSCKICQLSFDLVKKKRVLAAFSLPIFPSKMRHRFTLELDFSKFE